MIACNDVVYNDAATAHYVYIRATYCDSKDTRDTDIYLYLLSSSIEYDGEYEKVQTDYKISYFATIKNITNNKTKNKKASAYRFFGLIKSNDSDQALRYKYNIICEDEKKDVPMI